jgi:hypothetical protein
MNYVANANGSNCMYSVCLTKNKEAQCITNGRCNIFIIYRYCLDKDFIL